jgi:hypothetical protein
MYTPYAMFESIEDGRTRGKLKEVLPPGFEGF